MQNNNYSTNKAVLIISLVAILLSSCSKSSNSIKPINCDNLVTDTLGTNDPAKIYMPTAFTPNQDGLNDLAMPLTEEIAAVNFIIYDEANNIVFETNQVDKGWPSAPSANDLKKFYYKIQATTTDNHQIGMCGEITAIWCRSQNVKMNNYTFQDQLSSDGFTKPTSETLLVCP